MYEELRRIAHLLLGRERPDHTLRTTALVHEAYFRLVDQSRAEITDRAHFLAVAAGAMRRILVDYARRRGALKRGGGMAEVSLSDAAQVAQERGENILRLDEALTRLAEVDERLSRVVECRFFGGLTEDEIADVLGVTTRTVRRDWVKAKGWLRHALRE